MMRIEEILAKALERVGNDRYVLALAVGQRADELSNGAKPLLDSNILRNMKYTEDKITYLNNLPNHCKAILCDAQTSGGLLIAMKEDDAKEYIKELEELSFGYATIIGHVIPRGITPIIVH